MLEEAVPRALWDLTGRVFLRPNPFKSLNCPTVIATHFFGTLVGSVVRRVILSGRRVEMPIC